MGEFLDHFYTANSDERIMSLVDEPILLKSKKLNVMFGAIAEHLAKNYTSESAPLWANKTTRFSAQPWFTTKNPDVALKEYLTWSSPAAFKRRNIMTDGSPLRRAAAPRVS